MSEFAKGKTKFEKMLLEKKSEMEHCNHLFVKQEEGYWIGGFHSSDYEYTPSVITCLKCGLTNYHVNMDIIQRRQYSDALMQFNRLKYCWLAVNDEVFRKQFHSSKEGESKYNLISNEVLQTTNPTTLYKIAVYINPDANNEELFNIMKKLYDIEKIEGTIDIKNEKQLEHIKEKMNNEKVLSKKI